MSTSTPRAARPLDIAGLRLRNRIVGTAHGARPRRGRRAAARGRRVLAPPGGGRRGDADRRRHGDRAGVDVAAADHDRGVATGGASPGMAARAEAIRAEGAVAACQLVHLGRETTGAETWYHPVAPSAVRSPREPTRPRPLTDDEVDAIVEGFRRLGGQRGRGGLPGRRAARGARLPPRPVPLRRDEPPAGRRAPSGSGSWRGSSRAIRASAPEAGPRHPAVGRGRRGGRAHARRAVRAAAARRARSPTT